MHSEFSIRTTASVVSQKLSLETSTSKKRLFSRLSRKLRKKALRNTILGANLLILALVFAFLVHNTSAGQGNAQPVVVASDSADSGSLTDPLNQLSTVQIAVQVARMTGIYEATSVTNLADSESAAVNVAQADNQVVAKPQVISTNAPSRDDIVSYVTQPGDTLSSLAIKFGVTSNSIQWSNELKAATITPGMKLVIPPVNGIVYTVQAGDTIASLAQKYDADSAQITSINDAEISGITTGEQIIIPNGSLQTTSNSSSSYAVNALNSNFTPTYGYNGYDYGYCTWFVANQIAVPSNWGNASSWAFYAAASGWNVSLTPAVGSIAQTAAAAGGEGHVGIVEAISPDGSSVEVKDMNNYGDGGGFGRVGEAWVPVSSYEHYITH